jgi:hypothetical protein
MRGKALFFKIIEVQEKEYRGDFRMAPDGLTLTEAADMLTEQVVVAAIRWVARRTGKMHSWVANVQRSLGPTVNAAHWQEFQFWRYVILGIELLMRLL